MKPGETRLILEIDRALHSSIKIISAQHHRTMKQFIIEAVAEKMNRINEENREELGGQKK